MAVKRDLNQEDNNYERKIEKKKLIRWETFCLRCLLPEIKIFPKML